MAAYSAAFGVCPLVASLAFGQAPALVTFGGLLQRVAVSTGFTWLTAVHGRALPGR